MANCVKCGVELDNTRNCTNCGEPVGAIEEKNPLGFLFLGLFVPFIGFILFLLRKNDRPKSAVMSLIGAVINFSFLFFMIFILAFLIPYIGHLLENAQ